MSGREQGSPRHVRSVGARREERLAWLLCSPAVLVMLGVAAYPVGYAVYLSLQRYDLRFPGLAHFVGFGNYAAVLSSPFWWQALSVTVVLTVVSVAVELVLGILLALVMYRTVLGRDAVRTLVLIPYGIVTVVAAFSWQYAWTPGTGYLANLLPSGSAPLTHHWQSLALIVLAEVWKTTPFVALLLLTGLALVPEDLLRAALVDGASTWQRFVMITLPLMKPAIMVALLFRTLDAFRIFDNIYVLTSGANGTGSVSILGYDNLFTALNLGIGAAISVLVFLCVALITSLSFALFGGVAPGREGSRR
ncbi:carbohydrate ABC transporter permease [Streptomyces sioyaensis]|uniref:carbohydrate ABC transporter permease n=1 Tax=Streptomyces sioyaensis TaxID=67364 RepID=UPI00378EE509